MTCSDCGQTISKHADNTFACSCEFASPAAGDDFPLCWIAEDEWGNTLEGKYNSLRQMYDAGEFVPDFP